ncbi:acetoin utilization protein AcuC [Lichenicola sp.]|uniref:acetoin utilization protein AcuC n=1 Tax=Lichenicola sp. TaxID=2804529 RepID=UPI003B006AF6
MQLPDPAGLPVLIGSEITRHSSFGAWHPLSIPRVTVALDLIRAMGWIDPERYLDAPMAEPAEVWRFHDAGYVAALQDAEATQQVSEDVRERYGIGVGSNPIYPEMYRRPMIGAGGLMLAARLTAGGRGIVHCLGGGTHHGRPDRPSGFCYLNDVVLALLVWQELGLERIAYVDLDAHHGDAVQDAFAEDDRVLTLSVHEERRWPFTGLASDRAGGAARNMPVPRGLNDSEMRVLVQDAMLPLVRAHRPQAVFVQAGADALEEDPLSRLALSNNALVDAVAGLRDLAAELGVPLIVTGGGGYNPFSTGRCWALLWAALNRIPVPPGVTSEAEAVLRALTFRRGNGRNPPAHWFTSLADAPREGPVRPEIRRLVEIVLEE